MNVIRNRFPALRIVSDAGQVSRHATHVLYSHRCRAYATLTINGIKYGANSHPRGCRLSQAYIASRRACRIHQLLSVHIDALGDGQDVDIDLAVIEPRIPASLKRRSPWNSWYVINTLCIQVCQAELRSR